MLLIFDCDGVLRSVSWEAMYQAYVATAEYIGRNPADFWQNAADFRKWHDNDWHFNLERMGIPHGSDYSAVNKIFHDIYDPSITVFRWVEKVLKHLKNKGHILTVLSGAKFDSVFNSLKPFVGYFATIKAADHVVRIKPDPEGIHLIMNEFGIKAGETVMIGDSVADIQAGRSARVWTVGVTWGMTDFDEMKNLEPHLLFCDPMQLKTL